MAHPSRRDFFKASAAIAAAGTLLAEHLSAAAKDVKPVELAYAIEGFDGQVLVQVSTPSIALGRAYTPTAAGAVPASPLSIMQRN